MNTTAPPLAESEAEWIERIALVGRFGPRPGMILWLDDLPCVKIPLTQGKVALIDWDDYEDIGRWRWYAFEDRSTWYARRALVSRPLKLIAMHSQITGWLFPDHKNRNGLDNRKSNLRPAGRSVNKQNTPAYSATGYKGVYRSPYGRFVSQIRVAGELHHFGTFTNPVDAAMAYDIGAIQFFGEGASVNFPLNA